MRLCLLAILTALMFSSCYSYKIFPKEYRHFNYEGEKKTAYIINPELSKETHILKKSGIFNLTDDSLNVSAVKIQLQPLERSFVCGEPILGSLITLGQVPVLLPDRYQYTFTEISGTDTTQKQFELKIATRYWFWDMFAVNKKFKQKAGQTLLAEYYSNSNSLK